MNVSCFCPGHALYRKGMTIRIAILGYGNLGRAVEQSVQAAPDMEAVVVFTRRDPASLATAGTPVAPVAEMDQWVDRVDLCLCCGGSATDLDEQVPQALEFFPTVDTFDTHPRIPEYFAKVDERARAFDRAAVISTGWDPGMFSIQRALGEAILPAGHTETFWGPGLSQGHSDALRRVEGVAGAVQYTLPVEAAKERAAAGEGEGLTTRDKHRRQCFVVAEDGADQARIRQTIVSMPNYFSDYDVEVNFISAQELARDHSGMPHAGEVIRHGATPGGANHVTRYSLDLQSNPQFTAAMVTATARALSRMLAAGARGALTVFDIPPGYYHEKSGEELRAELL